MRARGRMNGPARSQVFESAGFTIVALTPAKRRQKTLEAFAVRPHAARIALLVGTEGAGLTAEAEAMADDLVRIPIDAAVDSLNLAVAAGIALCRASNVNGERRTANQRRTTTPKVNGGLKTRSARRARLAAALPQMSALRRTANRRRR